MFNFGLERSILPATAEAKTAATRDVAAATGMFVTGLCFIGCGHDSISVLAAQTLIFQFTKL